MSEDELRALAIIVAAVVSRPAAAQSPGERRAVTELSTLLGTHNPGWGYDPGTGSLTAHIMGRLRPLIIRENEA